MPDGTRLKVFLTGNNWEDDFGKVQTVVKIKDKLYIADEFHYIDDVDCSDGYDMVAAAIVKHGHCYE